MTTMRHFMTLCEGVTNIGDMRAWVDPSKAQLLALAKRITLRGTVVDGHIYVWDARDQTHYGIHSTLVGPEEEYLSEDDFMIGRPSSGEMDDYLNGNEVEIAPGIVLNGNQGALSHPVIRSLIKPTTLRESDEGLFWFWYRPSDGKLVHTDGTHTTEAYYNMGYGVEGEDFDDLADEDILSRALNDGWVRGRYGERSARGSWNALESPNARDLSLQGRRDLVLKTARFVAAHHSFSNLYIDFTIDGAVHDAMDSIHLTDDRLETYLRRGVVRR